MGTAKENFRVNMDELMSLGLGGFSTFILGKAPAMGRSP